MLEIIQSLLAKADSKVDSIHVAGLLAMLSLIAISAYAAYAAPTGYSPVAYGTGASSVLAAIGAGRRLRDGPAQPPAGDPQ